MFNITGTLKVKNAAQQVSEKFKKREFVITDNSSQYPQFLSFQLTQDKCNLLDSYNLGDEIKVYFNLRGREWKDKNGETRFFNSLEAWKLEGNASAGSNNSYSQEPAGSFASSSSQEDDLPF